jgi:[ribosomal protein S5]-alanine N-acetyltransferase
MQTLHTSRLVLEPRVAAHAEALYPLLADPRQREFHDDDPVSLEALRERFRKGGDAQAIGFVQATVLDDHRAWVAYQVATARWGQGIASEATRAMVEHLIAHYAVTQCLATVDRRNQRSWRLLERLGFSRADAERAAAMQVQTGDFLYLR